MGVLQEKPHNHTILKLIYHSGYKGTLWCQFGGKTKKLHTSSVRNKAVSFVTVGTYNFCLEVHTHI